MRGFANWIVSLGLALLIWTIFYYSQMTDNAKGGTEEMGKFEGKEGKGKLQIKAAISRIYNLHIMLNNN